MQGIEREREIVQLNVEYLKNVREESDIAKYRV